jgi:signal peptidase I
LASKKKLLKNDTFQTAIVIVLIVLVVLGFWYGSQLVLNTKIPPALAVVSGSMCIPYDGACEGWLSVNHPFERTLHKGDIIIIQGVDPKSLNANYPNSDIIVFTDPYNSNELIVHRIIGKTEVNGVTYFATKGDGNGNKWPQPPQSGLDPWDLNEPSGVPQNLVIGKVIMRIPWIGWVAIFMQWAQQQLHLGAFTLGIPIIILLIVLLIIIEFVLPLLRRNKTNAPKNDLEKSGEIPSQIIQLQSC